MKGAIFLAVALLSPINTTAQDSEHAHRFHVTRTWVALTGVSVAAAFADSATQIQLKRLVGGNPERDPLARPFTALPTPAYLAVTGAFAGGVAYLGHRMESSHRPVLRKLWWLPQVAQATVNTTFAAQNEVKNQKLKYEIELGIQAGTYAPPGYTLPYPNNLMRGSVGGVHFQP